MPTLGLTQVPTDTLVHVLRLVHRGELTCPLSPHGLGFTAELGYVPFLKQPDEFGAFIKSEIETLGKVIRQAGIKVQ